MVESQGRVDPVIEEDNIDVFYPEVCGTYLYFDATVRLEDRIELRRYCMEVYPDFWSERKTAGLGVTFLQVEIKRHVNELEFDLIRVWQS